MRNVIHVVIGIVLFSLLASMNHVLAHLSGPPYVKLNGIYAQTNTILTYTTPTSFSLGSDVASPSAYVVNTPIQFEVDEQFFPNPYAADPTQKITPVYRWDFGDGSPKQEGKKVSHTYVKSGTYVADLEAKFPGKVEEFTGINPIQINILPHSGYELPVARVSINGKEVADPARDIIELYGNRPIQFDASVSKGKIVSYQWDFSDESSGSGAVVSHRYKNSDYFPMFPVLRVVDENNIVSDTFVFLDMPQNKNIFMQLVGWIQDVIYSLKERFIQ